MTQWQLLLIHFMPYVQHSSGASLCFFQPPAVFLHRPFPLILGSIFDRLSNASDIFYPIEFTPLYIGCPAVYLSPANPNETVGGGYVDPQGFNSAPPHPAPVVPPALAATLGSAPPGFGAPFIVEEPATTAVVASNGSAPAPSTGRRNLHRHLLQAPAVLAGGNSTATGSVSNTTAAAPLPGAAPPAATDAELNTYLPLNTTVKSSYVLPLKSMVGISSSFLAQGLRPDASVWQELTGTEQLDYWNQVGYWRWARLVGP